MARLAKLLPLLLVALAAALTAAPSAGAVTIGIADQKPDMFSDARFAASGMTHARLAVSWDALDYRAQRAQLDGWLRAAHAAGVQPLVSFMHSRSKKRGSRASVPTTGVFLAHFKRFRARYPWVQDFATWNEVNHCGEPMCHRPALVASYWRAISAACRSCRILAGEMLDAPNMVSWIREFRRAARREPRYWGLHNYVDANRFRTTGTRRMLSAVKGFVWLTEVGGIVKRRTKNKIPLPESAAHAARATTFLFQRLVPLSRRIQRVYVYQWNVHSPRVKWDSALIGPNGGARPALRIVQRQLTLQAARAAARR
jgi:polysaccharide biosynthesis protein PslG